ncbi:hypothetical protein E4T56_gene12246 [Termitomyces sp. T112]|nr:hypothetical protein E4T56_gene12246 [Termitomyces sp. T112]
MIPGLTHRRALPTQDTRTPPLPESRRPSRKDKSYRMTRTTHKLQDNASHSTSSQFVRMKLSDGCASSCTSSERFFHRRTFGTGEAIWSRVATVASNLTVSVSKAWAANLTTFVGEETPAGQESRLTRAMKAYHLEKSRDPTDLPTWLFDGSERCRLSNFRSRSPFFLKESLQHILLAGSIS